ncbi:MAG TPA: 50S ribosomal protein L18 [Bryobacteraceae bacterium]|nr:50S ribosomal protein L18 [Bryobacteraceae bacterium]
MIQRTNKNEIRWRIHKRIRRKVRGTPERPRLAIFRSLSHIYAQIVDDTKGQTIVAAASSEKALRGAATAAAPAPEPEPAPETPAPKAEKGAKGDKGEKKAAKKAAPPVKASGGNVAGAKLIGKTIAERAKEKGIKQVVFDRGGYIYHGRVKALADAARAAGLEF